MDETHEQGAEASPRRPRRGSVAAGAALLASVAAIGAATVGTGSATAAPDSAGTSAVPAQNGTPPGGSGAEAPRDEDCPEGADGQDGAGAGATTAPEPAPSGGIDDGSFGV